MTGDNQIETTSTLSIQNPGSSSNGRSFTGRIKKCSSLCHRRSGAWCPAHWWALWSRYAGCAWIMPLTKHFRLRMDASSHRSQPFLIVVSSASGHGRRSLSASRTHWGSCRPLEAVRLLALCKTQRVSSGNGHGEAEVMWGWAVASPAHLVSLMKIAT